MLSLAGYMPDLICCQNCAVYEADDMVFLPKSGVIYCGNCYKPTSEFAFHMGKGVMTGLRHTIYADFDKLFSFQLQPKVKTTGANYGTIYAANVGTAIYDFGLLPPSS